MLLGFCPSVALHEISLCYFELIFVYRQIDYHLNQLRPIRSSFAASRSISSSPSFGISVCKPLLLTLPLTPRGIILSHSLGCITKTQRIN